MTSIQDMIETIRRYGIIDEKVINAMEKIDRKLFLPENMKDLAYDDGPLPIGFGQTISQPFTVAFMLQALELKKTDKVLEIGCGSGYNAALLKEIVSNGKVISIEIVSGLIETAKNNLKKAKKQVKVIAADGSLGYKQDAPYDKIIATAACPKIPKPWTEQLKNNGIIVAPVGRFVQQMIKARKIDNEIITESLGNFRFVPLKGRHGF